MLVVEAVAPDVVMVEEVDLDAGPPPSPTCDACGAPATVMVPDGTPSKLPLCGVCAARS